jgi:inorganic pyrophosphatase/exopolyphosphatase
VLALTNKLSFSKGDEANLTNGNKVEVKRAFKPKQLNDINYGMRKTLWKRIVKLVKEADRDEAEKLLVKYNELTRAKRTLEDVEV